MAERAQPLSARPGWSAAALVAVLIFGALLAVALRAETGRGFNAADWAALRFTLVQATLSALFSVLLAIPVARALARRRFRGRSLLIALLGAPFILPVIVAVLGLIEVFGRGGWVSAALGTLSLPPVQIYGLHGVVLAHVFFNLPLATRLVLQGWQEIPAERFRLATLLGIDGWSMFRVIELPMLLRLVPGAFTVIFAICLTSFAVALTLGGGPRATTIELAIYQAFRFDFDLGRAALLSAVQLGLTVFAGGIALWLARGEGFGSGLDRGLRRFDGKTTTARCIDALFILVAAVFLLVPLMAIALSGLPGFADMPGQVWTAALTSLWVAALSTVLLLCMALPMATAIATERGRMVEIAGLLGLAASPLVIGTGLFIAIRPYANPQAFALPVTALVNAITVLPFALRILVPRARDIMARQGRLGLSLGMAGLPFLRHVLLPRLRPQIGFAAGLAAALSMGDLGVITLFADPDVATLPLQIYRLMGSYQMEAAAAASFLLLILSFGVFWLLDRGGTAMLKLEGATIRNGSFALTADLTVPDSATVAVIGPSGAGKSTLIEGIAGFLPVKHGRITWDGIDITDQPPGARPVAMLFQEDNLFPHLTLAQNVGLGLSPNLRLSQDDRTRVTAALDRVGLAGMDTRKPGELSGGQRSRAALARVMLQDKPLLLLDEPFAALGPALRMEMLDLVAEIAGETGATIMMISHAPEDARRITAQAILVADATAHAPQPTADLLDDPPPVLRDYLGS